MNNPEYCQNIYDAAKKVVRYYMEEPKKQYDEIAFDALMGKLRDALEGKPIDDQKALINQVRHLHD